MQTDTHWIFGYGSLIYKVDFPILRREVASLRGWTRRFWQGSHDHRGTAERPGRVVTLVEEPGALCRGMAFLVNEEVFSHLDHREKNGYERHQSTLELLDPGEHVEATFYIAAEGNVAFLGGGSDRELAEHIARSHGPSGSNADYLLSLAGALRDLGEEDEHVFNLERELLQLRGAQPPSRVTS